jgi:hypothetical protein
MIYSVGQAYLAQTSVIDFTVFFIVNGSRSISTLT